MSEIPRGQVTTLLRQIADGDAAARDELCRVVYGDLRGAAERLMRRERTGHTLQPTALVNEALVRLFDSSLLAEPATRRVFFGAATRAMRQILVEHARRRNAAKRGGEWHRTAWDDVVDVFEREQIDLEALDAALTKLEKLHIRQHQCIELRFFGGMQVGQIAELLGVSESTVEKDLNRARSFLFAEMADA